MQNILISTIRFGVIALLAFLVFMGEAFAAPILTPVIISSISDTTANLNAKVANPGWKTTTVWFEWGDTSNPTIATGMRDVFNEGFFPAYLSDLKPNTTYYVRAAAMEGGITVYSTVVSFKTSGGVVQSANTAKIVSEPRSQKNTTTQSSEKTDTSVSQTAPVQKTANSKNNNMAAVGNTADVPRGTLIGLVSFLIGIFTMFIVVMIIIDAIKERRKAREEMKKKKLERKNEE